MTAKKTGWVTLVTKDGKQKLDAPFYATNPAYIAAHKEWDWRECDGEHAAEMIQADYDRSMK